MVTRKERVIKYKIELMNGAKIQEEEIDLVIVDD